MTEGLPLYDADVEAEGDPEPVASFKLVDAVADGLLIRDSRAQRLRARRPPERHPIGRSC